MTQLRSLSPPPGSACTSSAPPPTATFALLSSMSPWPTLQRTLSWLGIRTLMTVVPAPVSDSSKARTSACYTPFVNPGRSSMAGHTSGATLRCPKIILCRAIAKWWGPFVNIILMGPLGNGPEVWPAIDERPGLSVTTMI
jgi:hypothetical protein